MSIVKVNYLRLSCCKESNARFYDRSKYIMSLSYDGFKTRLTTEVPHLEKIGSFLRLIILEKDASYFNFQIKGLLEKEKSITIKAFAFASPGLHITNSSSLHRSTKS